MDTGTALIHLPKEYYNAIVGKWKKQILNGGFSFNRLNGLWEGSGNCLNYIHRVSNISFIIEGYSFEIKPQAYLMNCTDFSKKFCLMPDNCAFGVDSIYDEKEFDDNVFLLGDIFLKNFYSVFSAESDSKMPTISLALSRHYSGQAGIDKVRKNNAGFVLSMFIMWVLSIGSFYIYGGH